MNILFTGPTPFHPYRGGVGRVTDTLCREFQNNGHKVYYLNATWYMEERKNFNYPAPVIILPNEDLFSEENIKFYNKYLQEKKIDVVINQEGLYNAAYLFCNISKKNKNIKIISVVHNDPLRNYNHIWSELSFLRNNTLKEKIRRIVRCILYPEVKFRILLGIKKHYSYFKSNSSAIALLSKRYESSLIKKAPYLSDRIYSIANPNTYTDVKNIPTKENLIIYVGRLDNKQKKLNRLLIIWNYIYRNNPDWKLQIIGDGPDREKLEKYSKRLHLNQIEFCGFCDPKEYYERASIICMTSDFEGFPMTLVEAMQFGCVPIVFNSFAAVKDIVIDQKTGILVEPFKLKKYAKELQLLIDDKDKRIRMSENAFNWVKQFDVKTIVKQWISLIDKI